MKIDLVYRISESIEGKLYSDDQNFIKEEFQTLV